MACPCGGLLDAGTAAAHGSSPVLVVASVSASTSVCTRVRVVRGLADLVALGLAGLAVFSRAGLPEKIPQYQRTTPMINTPNAVLIISGNLSIRGTRW